MAQEPGPVAASFALAHVNPLLSVEMGAVRVVTLLGRSVAVSVRIPLKSSLPVK